MQGSGVEIIVKVLGLISADKCHKQTVKVCRTDGVQTQILNSRILNYHNENSSTH